MMRAEIDVLAVDRQSNGVPATRPVAAPKHRLLEENRGVSVNLRQIDRFVFAIAGFNVDAEL